MDFHNFHPIHVFEVKDSTADILTELPYVFEWPRKSKSTSGLKVYWWYCLMNCFRGQGIHCWYFYRATLFQLPRKSRSTSGCKGTSEVLIILSDGFSQFLHYLCFSRSRNPLLTFLLSYDVWVTTIIQVNFRFERYWWFCLMKCWNFYTIRVFEVRKSIADISTELPCLGNLENPGKLSVQDVIGGTGECVL